MPRRDKARNQSRLIAASPTFGHSSINVTANVTNQITHLVVGDQDLGVLAGHTKSSKHRKAEEMRAAGHPILIMGEADFKRALSAVGVMT